VWALTNQSVSSVLAANVSFEVPKHVLHANATLCGFFMIAPAAPVPAPGEEEARGLWNNDTHADSDSLLVVVPVTLAQQRAPARSTGKRRHLLDTDRTGSSTTSAASSSDSAHSLHSPYLYYPLILRHVELYDVLDSRSIHPMAATSLQPRKRATDDTRGKWVDGMPPIQNYFNPLLWHDDLSIPAKHSFALPRKAPVKSSVDAADVSTDEKGMVDENPVVMSFEFQFTPTSLMYYSLKRVVQTNMRIIRDLVGEESLDELRYWLSEDRMFMMLATQVVGWLHIIFEYLAFRDDYQFFKVRVCILYLIDLFEKQCRLLGSDECFKFEWHIFAGKEELPWHQRVVPCFPVVPICHPIPLLRRPRYFLASLGRHFEGKRVVFVCKNIFNSKECACRTYCTMGGRCLRSYSPRYNFRVR
jgi:hypothetical protein